MAKLFTLMTCTHNNANLLRLALEKMLALDSLEDFVEAIVVVDNASTDNTENVVREYMKEHPILRYEYEPKQGVTQARRHAAELNTDWLIYVDDDNLLSENYVERAAELVQRNPKAGVINGAGIAVPVPGESFTSQEQKRLDVTAAYLACSYPSEQSYRNGDKSISVSPYGAGVVLRTAPLKEFSQQGWTNNEGRNGSVLTSGEDGEIIRFVLNQGYEYLFDMEMYFYHIMPKKRLSEDYLSRLYQGIGHGMYRFHKASYGRMKTITYFLENCMKLVAFAFLSILPLPESKKLDYHFKAYSWKAYNTCFFSRENEERVVKRL